MGATAQPLNVNPTVAAFGQLGQSNAQRRQRRDAQRSALYRTAGALGGLAISGGNPLGAAIGGEVGGALAGQAPNVPALVQQFATQQAGAQQQEQLGALQTALTPTAQDDLGFEGTAVTQPAIDRGRVSAALAPLAPGAAAQLAFGGGRGAERRQIAKDVGGRQRFVDTGELAFPRAQAPEETTTQRIVKDATGRQRFVESGKLVFPKVTVAPKVTDPKPIRDTAFVNVAPVGQTPIWETRAITSDDQVAALVKKHGQDRVTLEDPRRGQAAASEQLLRERRRAAQVGAAGAPAPPSAPIPAPTAGAGQRTGRTLEAIQGGGIGPASNLAEVIDNVVGGLGLQGLIGMEGSLFPEIQKNRQHLRAMRLRFQGIFKQSNRFAKWEKEQIEPILPDPDKFWKNPATSANQLVELRSLLESKLGLNNNAIRSGTLTDKQTNDLNLKNIEINEMLSFMGGTPSQSQTQPATQQQDAQLFNVDTSGMSLSERKAHNDKLERVLGGGVFQ